MLRWYEPLVVPGLLQTEDYPRGASAVSAAVGYEFSLIPRVYFWKVRRVYSERSALEEEDERDY